MLLQVLGTAAGGGLPQWNCACPGCAGARAHPHRRRHHASLAVRVADHRWYVVNAGPDLTDQIEASLALHPGPGLRETPSPVSSSRTPNSTTPSASPGSARPAPESRCGRPRPYGTRC